jgi:hypothetical protein
MHIASLRVFSSYTKSEARSPMVWEGYDLIWCITIVEWVLESTTDTCQLSTWLYTHLHDKSEKKPETWFW